jgi:hypothetical protein
MIGPPDVYDEFDPLQEKHRVLRGDFAGAMRETRICVVGSSFQIRAHFCRRLVFSILSPLFLSASLTHRSNGN